MYFHHLHFYVKDTSVWQAWFTHKLGFQASKDRQSARSPIKLIQNGIEIWLSEPSQSLAVKQYLDRHPAGLVDIAFATNRFDPLLEQAKGQGALLSAPVRTDASTGLRQVQLQGWADLRHSVVEVSDRWVEQHQPQQSQAFSAAQRPWLSLIDHVVINVPQGELQSAVAWYRAVFDLQLGQSFEINTAHSGLCSQVLVHPEGTVQMPINEPSSANSQVQEFLDHNKGAGVQHVALRSPNAVSAIAHFRHQGLRLLNVPHTYYEDLHQRASCPMDDLSDVSRQQLLIDWSKGGQHGMLLQTFTEPIFTEPTFFFEIIERSYYQENGQLKTAEGFGEGNFQALFEAIERAQVERGSLGH